MSGSAGTSSASSAPSGLSMVQHPLNTVTAAVRHAPGAAAVKGAVEGVLDTVGAASPQARRVAAYAGAGLLGVVGVVEWPVAAAGAAVVWLTQPRRRNADGAAARPAAAKSPAGQAQPDQRPKPAAKRSAAQPAAEPTAERPAKAAKATKATNKPTAKRAAKPTAKPTPKPKQPAARSSRTAAKATASPRRTGSAARGKSS